MIESAFILQNFGDTIINFFQNVRIVDVLDIAIISFFLYLILNWLRQSASRRSFLSFSVLIVIYFIARFSGMYLTEYLIEGIFIIILIGIVVVFQSDMRRIFDRIGSWSMFGNSSSTSSNIATSIITEATAKMAEKKTGALIVIKGKESWERHMHGGIELNGQITIPLLHSIFNKYAPGHDGAVLLEGNKITKFGVHLPLSTNLYKMSRGGTRHTAALGISEQCDALVVIVSEERGAISIAKDGQIDELESSSDLKKHLDEFWSEHYQVNSSSFTQWWKRRSLRTALAAVALSIILWLTFAYPWDIGIRSFDVPIEFKNLQSSNVVLQDSIPSQATIRVSGSDQAFRTLDQSGLLISFDLATENINDGILEISGENINLPADLRFFEASPPTLSLRPQKFSTLEVPVKITTTGTIRSNLQLVSLTASPSVIQVLADTTNNLPDSISTEPVDLRTIQTSATIQKRLRLNARSFKLPDQASNQVYIKIEVRKNSE